jgi:hypothetical protein
MKTERKESATTRWLADRTFVTLMPKKLKNPIEILNVALSMQAARAEGGGLRGEHVGEDGEQDHGVVGHHVQRLQAVFEARVWRYNS